MRAAAVGAFMRICNPPQAWQYPRVTLAEARRLLCCPVLSIAPSGTTPAYKTRSCIRRLRAFSRLDGNGSFNGALDLSRWGAVRTST